jgi:hypothetical protein
MEKTQKDDMEDPRGLAKLKLNSKSSIQNKNQMEKNQSIKESPDFKKKSKEYENTI